MGDWDVNWAAVAPLLALAVAFIAYCIVDVARHKVRHLPKWAWIVICCGSVPMGGIVYLLIGKDPGDSR
ncbi:MAG: PLDc_N domain-containing protein [Demequinaceae bacterium]|nr:PLDc_N domain-containing protein [Demequinaceae bacterium]